VPTASWGADTIVDLALGTPLTGTPFRHGRLAYLPAAFVYVVIGELLHWRFVG
jgi:hypothetical protein